MKLLSPYQARVSMVVALFVGLFASAYLLYTYVTGGPIACALVSGCEIVRSSKWAYTFGIPRPLLGIVFYAGLFALLVLRVAWNWKPRLLYWLTMLAAAVGVIESAFLFFVQWLDIRAFCFWCLLSAVTALVIAAVAPFDRAEDAREASAARELKTYFILLLIFVPIAFVGMAWLVWPKA
jgi:uncharacterized membrane protein